MPGRTLKRTLLGCASALLLLAAPAAAAPAWLPPANLSAPGRDASNPEVAMDAAGNTVAVWERQSTSGPGQVAQVAGRAAAGNFSAPSSLEEGGIEAQVAMSPDGEAIAAWWKLVLEPEFEKSHSSLFVSTRAPGAASFPSPVVVKALAPGVVPGATRLAVNASGDVVVAWNNQTLSDQTFVEASVRPAGGSFSEPQAVSPQPATSEESASLGGVAIDGAGAATVVWQYENATTTLIEAALWPPGGPFDAPVQASPTPGAGEFAIEPGVASDASGHTTVVWDLVGTSAGTVEAADREGAGFSSPLPLSEAGELAFQPEIASSPEGAMTVIWQLSEGASATVQAARRAAPSAPFSSPEDVSEPTGLVPAPVLAVNGGGEAVVAWSGLSGAESIVQASIGKPGASFSAPVGISATSPEVMRPAVAIDAAGDATVLWPRSDGSNDIVQFAGYDAFAPQLTGVSIPDRGTVGTPVSFSATPFDVWPIAPASFDFGDGGRASGATVTHTYAAPGAYRVAVGASDAAGTAASPVEGTITIVPRGDFRLGRLKLNRRKGTATLSVEVSGAGLVVLTGKGLAKARAHPPRADSLKLGVRARGKALRRLRASGRLKVQLKVAFTPTGGSTAVQMRRGRLVRKRR